jgi:hypothetical protein
LRAGGFFNILKKERRTKKSEEKEKELIINILFL